MNGDGIDDIIIGAAGADPNGQSYAGESYVVFGSSDGFSSSLDLSALDGSNGFRIDGIDENDFSGTPVSAAGDVNGDGIDDIIIGASGADPNGQSSAGESYVVFGSSDGFSSSLDLSALDGSNGFRIDGIDEDDNSGVSVSGAGDVNGDGIDDVIVGAERADPNGQSRAGESYVVFGSSDGFSGSLELSALDGSNGFRIDGIDEDDYSGRSVSGTGDVNGDGIDDIIIGASGADPNGQSSAGESYVVFGSSDGFFSSLDLSALDGSNGFRIDGIDEDDFSGVSVSGAGDVNGDGVDDIIVGADFADPNGQSVAGESYVVFGSSDGFSSSLDLPSLNGSNGFRIDGIDGTDRSGFSVSGAGDVNGDGFDDVIIGAPYADLSGKFNVGQSYVVFGFETVAPEIPAGQSFSYDENQLSGFGVGTVVATDNMAVTGFAITDGDPDGFFAIDSTGKITLTADGAAGAANDFENGANSFTLTAEAEDAKGNTASETVEITVEDVDEVPPEIPANQSFSYAENQLSGFGVGTVAATDNVAVKGFAITGGDPNTFFAIDNTGAITLTAAGAAGAANDFEDGANSFTVTVEAEDAEGNTSSETVEITVEDVDEVPPDIPAGQSFSYDENQSAGFGVGTVVATDNVAVTGFAITGGDPNTFFAIDNTGAITLTAAGAAGAANDFEDGANSFTLTVEAEDAEGNTSSETVEITVEDVASPDVSFDVAATRHNRPVEIDVLANDGDPDGGPLAVVDVTAPTNGTVEINDDGTITYTPDRRFRGEDGFTYTVENDGGEQTTATVYVKVGDRPVEGTDSADVLAAARANVVFGDDGRDTIFGRSDDDVIDGQGGRDLVYGGDGDDLIFSSEGSDVLFGEAGDDTIVIGFDETARTFIIADASFNSFGTRDRSDNRSTDTLIIVVDEDTLADAGFQAAADAFRDDIDATGGGAFTFGNSTVWADDFEEIFFVNDADLLALL